MSAQSIENHDWNFDALARHIENGKCILLLGPEFPLFDQPDDLDVVLKKYLEENHIYDLVHFNRDGFFSFKDEDEKQRTYFRIIDFFRDLKPSRLHEKIAELPFKVIISLSPDHLLKTTFEEKGRPFDFHYFHKDKNPKRIQNEPSPGKPLIYNMFGSIDEEDSMIFTYDDMFDYIINISRDHELPEQLQTELNNTKNYIFLGFDYDKWYLKLLLRIMNLHNKKVIKAHGMELEAMLKEAGVRIDPNIKTLYKKLFELEFIDSCNVDSFVEKLYQKCKDRNILIESTHGKTEDVSNTIHDLLAKNKIEEAISNLEAYLNKNKLRDKIEITTRLKGHFAKTKEDYTTFLINRETMQSEEARVTSAIMNLLKTVT